MERKITYLTQLNNVDSFKTQTQTNTSNQKIVFQILFSTEILILHWQDQNDGIASGGVLTTDYLEDKQNGADNRHGDVVDLYITEDSVTIDEHDNYYLIWLHSK